MERLTGIKNLCPFLQEKNKLILRQQDLSAGCQGIKIPK